MSKSRITIRLDDEVLDYFKSKTDRGYQTLINSTLVEYINSGGADKKLRDILREELSRINLVETGVIA